MKNLDFMDLRLHCLLIAAVYDDWSASVFGWLTSELQESLSHWMEV